VSSNRSTAPIAPADRIVAWALRVASTALVFAGVALFVAGIPLLQAASDALRDILLVEESKPRPEEYERIRGVVERYTAAVTPRARALGWVWLGFAIWIPPLVLSARRR
jgi:hypothetical protein